VNQWVSVQIASLGPLKELYIMKRSTYIRQSKKRRKKYVRLLRTMGFFVACDGNVYAIDQSKLLHPKYVDGNPFRCYEVEGISVIDANKRHECDIDHCLVDILNRNEVIEYQKSLTVGEDG
jgi:hypothetical protein